MVNSWGVTPLPVQFNTCSVVVLTGNRRTPGPATTLAWSLAGAARGRLRCHWEVGGSGSVNQSWRRREGWGMPLLAQSMVGTCGRSLRKHEFPCLKWQRVWQRLVATILFSKPNHKRRSAWCCQGLSSVRKYEKSWHAVQLKKRSVSSRWVVRGLIQCKNTAGIARLGIACRKYVECK